MKDRSGKFVDVEIKQKKYKNATPSKPKLPKKGNYFEYRVDPNKIFDVENKKRIVIDVISGDVWYSPDHYKHFIKILGRGV